MLKTLVTGVAAIALLVAGSVVILLVLTGDERPRTGAGTSPPQVESETYTRNMREGRMPATPPPGEITFGGSAPAEPPPVQVVPAAPPPAPGSWEAVPITARAKGLGRVGAMIQAALNDLHDELRTCFTAEGQSRLGGEAVTAVKDAAPMDDAGSIVLVLQLETLSGSVRVVDAPVETRGPAGDELLACAQRVLRGRELEVPGARPGGKHRLLYTLTP